MPLLLGIDAGSTVTKSVLFDLDGAEVATASRRVRVTTPHPHHVERDQDELWEAVAATVRELLHDVPAAEVLAVGVTSHGDGVYLVDGSGRPVRPGIMSLDTRARSIVERWDASGVSDRALELTGQRPWPSAPATLLAWLWEHEPEAMAATRFVLPAKDALKQRLTGEISTEPTEASLSFTNVATQRYDEAVLELFDLARSSGHLAPVVPCASISGTVTAEAAEATGLRPGTPVAASAHDVDCAAIGTGVIAPGYVSAIAGTFSINQTITAAPAISADWCARSFVLPGRWMNMSISPTSAANMEWFAQEFFAHDLARDEFAFIERELALVQSSPSEIVYLPFLFGSPLPLDASATFAGLRGWHTRGHVLRAVMQGVALTHRRHIDRLTAGLPAERVRLTGGASRSPAWSQIFADALGRPVEVTTGRETGALGASMLAGIAVGAYRDLDEATARTVRIAAAYAPRATESAELDGLYARYESVLTALTPVWDGARAR